MIEFLPVALPSLVQCSACGAVVASGNADIHLEFHRSIAELEKLGG